MSDSEEFEPVKLVESALERFSMQVLAGQFENDKQYTILVKNTSNEYIS